MSLEPRHPRVRFSPARQPAVALAVCFIAGLLVSRSAAAWTDLWLGIAAGLTLTASVLIRQAAFSSSALAAATLMAGLLAGQLQLYCYPGNHIAAFTDDVRRLARLRVHLDDPPRMIHAQHRHARQATRATVTEVMTKRGWERSAGRVVLQIADRTRRFSAGQDLEVLGWLGRPEPAANPGQFDWAAYYRQQRIMARVEVTEAGCARIIASTPPNPVWPLRQRVRALLARGFAEHQAVDHALLRALLLGDNDPQLRDIQDLFIATGTSHHLAISGMHIAVLGGAVYLVCRVLCLRPRISAGVVLAFVLVYGTVALPSPPVLRSVILCALVVGGTLLRRSIDVVQLLALSMFAMLAVQPLDLFTPGFQLSFGTVFGLVTLTPWVNRKLESLRDPHARVAAGLVPAGPVVRAWNAAFGKIRGDVVAALVAWAVSLPMILYHFDRLNPYAILGSIALAPVVFLGLVGGVLKVLLTLLLPPLAPAWATLASAPMAAMRQMVEWLAALPGSDVPFPAPSPWMLLPIYALLFLPLVPWRPRLPAIRRLAPAGGLAIILAPWPLAVLQSQVPPPPSLRLTVLSVGAGSCAVIETPDGRVALIDAGSSNGQSLERNILRPFFRTRRIGRIDHLFVSHTKADHHNAVEEIITQHGAREVIVSDAFHAAAFGSPSAWQLLGSLRRMNHGPRLVSAGDRLTLGRDVSIDVLWPPADSRLEENDNSLVLRVTYAGRSILLPGDIESAAQRTLINTCPTLAADVLIAPQHGTSLDMTPFFVNEVNPSVIISSNDRMRTAKQLRFDREIGGRPLYRTDRHGAVTVTIDAAGRITSQTFVRR